MTEIKQTPIWASVREMAEVLAGENFPIGERAALKRMGIDGAAPLAFHRFVIKYIEDAYQNGPWRADWRTLICAMARQRNGGFNPAISLGQALAEAGYAESRMERLLSANGDTLRALILRAARQLTAKDVAIDWSQLAELLFCRDPESREKINTRIARDFYRSTPFKNREA
ncbi:MAG: type I-E CRISPR-associated protein Cse2/CasB [Deltaproteobacteria bacterium]|nr:type I-E CRISPR-associated protein Cse2/CasB [Deltaproteobacteria bacterium]